MLCSRTLRTDFTKPVELLKSIREEPTPNLGSDTQATLSEVLRHFSQFLNTKINPQSLHFELLLILIVIIPFYLEIMYADTDIVIK